jgi:hypothetical protein
MTKKKLKILFELAEELYAEECKKSGNCVEPFCWASNGNGGLLVFSAFGVPSKKLAKELRILNAGL